MHEQIRQMARSLGFSKTFFLPLTRLDAWRVRADALGVGSSLHADIPDAYPQATCIIWLAYGYTPFSPEERMSAYYLATQHGYPAAKALMEQIAQQGFYCEMASIPVRALALANGIGAQGMNGLLRLPELGSRFAIYALATDACMPLEESCYAAPCPEGCDACQRACPAGAILEKGIDATRCMRYHMSGAEYPDWIYKVQRNHMGCEICQHACPQNRHLPVAIPTPEEQAAFDLKRLIEGDTQAARALVGHNTTGNGRLTVEAIYFAAQQELYEEAIRTAAEKSEFPAVKNAAEKVLKQYFTKT